MKNKIGKLIVSVAMTASVSMFASVASAGDNAEAIAKLQSVKESYAASLRLEALHLHGDRRLREVQLLRRARKAQVACDRFKDFQLPQRGVLHWTSILCINDR